MLIPEVINRRGPLTKLVLGRHGSMLVQKKTKRNRTNQLNFYIPVKFSRCLGFSEATGNPSQARP